jgi:hypothetical protein
MPRSFTVFAVHFGPSDLHHHHGRSISSSQSPPLRHGSRLGAGADRMPALRPPFLSPAPSQNAATASAPAPSICRHSLLYPAWHVGSRTTRPARAVRGMPPTIALPAARARAAAAAAASPPSRRCGRARPAIVRGRQRRRAGHAPRPRRTLQPCDARCWAHLTTQLRSSVISQSETLSRRDSLTEPGSERALPGDDPLCAGVPIKKLGCGVRSRLATAHLLRYGEPTRPRQLLRGVQAANLKKRRLWLTWTSHDHNCVFEQ